MLKIVCKFPASKLTIDKVYDAYRIGGHFPKQFGGNFPCVFFRDRDNCFAGGYSNIDIDNPYEFTITYQGVSEFKKYYYILNDANTFEPMMYPVDLFITLDENRDKLIDCIL